MDSRIEELLVDWELARQQGAEPDPEQLCADCPELLPTLLRHIDSLSSMSWMLDRGVQGSDDEMYQKAIAELSDEDASDDSGLTTKLSAMELTECIVRLQLLSEDDTKQVRDLQHQLEQVAKPLSSRVFADQLIKTGLLSPYQAQCLLTGDGANLVLDRYVIQELIDQGGMGMVFKARHRSMDRVVAIKILPEHFQKLPERTARFEREIKAIAQLSHPNIVTAYDAHHVDGKFFLAMEYVEGTNLSDVVLSNGPLPAYEACHLIGQIAESLAEAHTKGIVHRDVKPSNILLTDSGDARLLDLGIAQFLYNDSTVGQTDLTEEGVPMGTIAYMSPEQAIDASKANELSDVYSLGCTLFFLLTGRPPYQRANPVQTLLDHREAAVPRLNEHRNSSEFPEQLQTCLDGMLAKNPADRIQSMSLIKQMLHPDQRLTTNPVSTLASSPKKITSPKPWLAAFGWRFLPLAILPLVILAGLFIWPGMNLWNTSVAKGNPESEASSHRDTAKWVLTSGGILEIESTMGQQTIADVAALPDSDFQITEIEMPPVGKTTSLVPIASLPHLRSVVFVGESAALYRFDELTNCMSLRTLVVDGVPLDSADVESFAKLVSLTDLTIVSGSLSAKDLESIFSMNNLRSLSLEETIVPQMALRQVSRLSNLTSLDLTNVFANDLSVLKEIAKLAKLQSLYLGGTDVRDDQIELFAQLPDLGFLSLDFCESVTADGISQLTHVPNLTGLQLEQTNVDDRGLERLIRDFPDLQVLDVARTQVTASSIPHLAKLKSLYQLSLAGLGITDNDVKQIAGMPGLQIVNLSQTDISDQALAILEPLQLVLLSVVECDISEQAILDYPHGLEIGVDDAFTP